LCSKNFAGNNSWNVREEVCLVRSDKSKCKTVFRKKKEKKKEKKYTHAKGTEQIVLVTTVCD
jgi:hypothetical protein